MFYSALVGLLRNGLADEDPALNGAYLNSYQVRKRCSAGVFFCKESVFSE